MTISVSIWSDIACPWCFVGKQRFERAAAEFARQHGGGEASDQVTINWRAFELDPRPRSPDSRPYAERLAQKYGRSVADAQQMIDTMATNIAREGGQADFNRIVVANTFDAHRLIQWAATLDAEGATDSAQHRLTDAFMRGYLGEGLDLSSQAQMLAVVEAAGLDQAAAQAVLAGDDFADKVREDEALAQHYGISGVPFFVIGRYGISGAQESAQLLEVLNTVRAEQAAALTAKADEPPTASAGAGSGACDIDGCDEPSNQGK
ncbi:DsbA family oxidoreductase [Simiduia sp. 21SJ11W-1]|uniref:DsbA family oxidoreductase n=1 Tax=Simiduia sp. 21SJ11W-1 TaxID=2909669 RepID=UPI0020A169F6|nr:DsbA family oxidoreductase [Simiduia sp. 21SJ11W-1]UTA46709.1 DsbA family oxidoreductase [Simiduia sp. 21SJ11W-1]